jgi:cytochrome P450
MNAPIHPEAQKAQPRLVPRAKTQFLTPPFVSFIRDPIRFFLDNHREVGEVFRFRLGNITATSTIDPAHVKRILQDNVENYGKHTRGYDVLRLYLGNGLLTSEGNFWLRQRRIAQPAFHRSRISGFAQTMTDMTLDTMASWEGPARRGEIIDMAEEINRLTLRIAGKTLLDADVDQDAAQVGESVTLLSQFANKAMTSILPVHDRFPTPTHLRFKVSGAKLDAIVERIISERRRDPGEAKDLLNMLMAARDADTGEGMSDKQLRDEVMTMFLAGHETTANALSWTLYLLSLHPTVERKLRDELERVLAGRPPTLEDIASLPYTEQVFSEAMRVYPPAWLFSRNAVNDDRLGPYEIKAGQMVFVPIYALHRNPRLWDNPEGFDPDRFSPEAKKERDKLAYIPFLAGARQCIGKSFAMMEGVLLLATILPRFRARLVPGHGVSMEPLVTLRPRHGIPMTLEKLA